MLYLIHHSRGSSELPKPYPGLPTILGSTPNCPSRSWLLQTLGRAESISTLACVAEHFFDAGSPHTLPPGPTGLTCSRKIHAEYKKATSEQDEMQGSLGEILWRGKDTFLLEIHLYFIVFSFYHY